MTIFDLITPAQLMLTAVAVGTLGALCVAFSRRKRAVPGVFPERARPWPAPPASGLRNARRPIAAPAGDDWADAVSAATLARLDAMSPDELRGTLVRSGIIDESGALSDAYRPGPRQAVSAWTDEPTLTSPRGES